MKLPTDAFKHHWAILGITGAGKSFTARGYIEAMLDAGQRVCIVDPKGDWWGLKSSADGKGPGYPVVIFGGDHADIPIDASSGAVLGDLVATGNRPCIIDLMHFSEAGKARFMVDFLGELHRKNKSRLTLVLEEAHEFCPQSSLPESTRMLHATNRLLSQGRSKGVQVVLSSQRPAKVHKDSLTQTQVLIAMRVISAQDRDAIEAWVAGVGDKKQAREVLDSLARLKTGEGWVYAPACDPPILERSTFPRIRTFDSGATPDGEDSPMPTGWSSVDLGEIRARFEAVKQDAIENDPKKLQAEVKRLKVELNKALATPVAVAPDEVDRLRTENRELAAQIFSHDETVKTFQKTMIDIAERAADMIEDLTTIEETARSAAELKPRTTEDRQRTKEKVIEELNRRADAAWKYFSDNPIVYPSGAGSHPVSNGVAMSPARRHVTRTAAAAKRTPHQKILDAIAWWNAAGVEHPERVQVACVAGYTVTGGTFSRYLSTLSSDNLIEYPRPGSLSLTDRGRAEAVEGEMPLSLQDFHDRVRGVLETPHRKILDVLIAAGGAPLGRTDVAERAGYEASGGTFNRYVSTLSSLGLVMYPKKTTVQASPLLFPSTLR